MKKHNKTTQRKRRIKRCIRRIAYTIIVAIISLCVALVSYILLVDMGVLKLHPVNRIEVESKHDTGYVSQKVELSNTKVDKDKLISESKKKSIVKPDVANASKEVEIEAIDNINPSTKSQDASESSTSTTNENVVTFEEEPIDMTPEIIQLNIIGEVDEKYIKQAKEELKLIPSVLKESFVSQEWILYLTTENLREKYSLGEGPMVVGYTSYDEHEMNFANTWSGVIITPSHEMGHYLDYINGFPSESGEFEQIYLEECPIFKANTLNTEWISDVREFFAEEFAYYVVDPSKCTPKAYQFIESQLKILEERSL